MANTFWIDGWDPDEEVKLSESECNQWCKVMLFVVPARVEGTWRFPQGELTLTQQYQMVSGTLAEGGRVTSISMGRMTGDQIAFSAGGTEYTGRLQGERIEGTVTSAGRATAWTATRSAP